MTINLTVKDSSSIRVWEWRSFWNQEIIDSSIHIVYSELHTTSSSYTLMEMSFLCCIFESLQDLFPDHSLWHLKRKHPLPCQNFFLRTEQKSNMCFNVEKQGFQYNLHVELVCLQHVWSMRKRSQSLADHPCICLSLSLSISDRLSCSLTHSFSTSVFQLYAYSFYSMFSSLNWAWP